MRVEDIVDIDLSECVAAKIWAKHAVSEEEVYEVFDNGEEVAKIRHSTQAPGSYLAYGRTNAGRYLVVALLPKAEGLVSVATARDMTRAERDRYERK